MGNIASLSVLIGAELDEFNKNLTKGEQRLKAFGKKVTKAGKNLSIGLTAPIVALGAASVIAFDKQAKAEASLRAAIKANGKEVEGTFAKYKKFASELQDVTTTGDEVTLGLIQMAEIMGSPAPAEAAKNAIGLAASLGIAEQSAIKMTAAASNGDFTLLNRYVPALKGVEDKSKAAAIAQKVFATGMEVAKAQALAGLGPFDQLRNTFGDLLEEFGAIISEGLKPFILFLKSLVKRFQALSPSVKKTIVIVAGLAAAIGPVLLALGVLIQIAPFVGAAFALMTGPIGLVIAGIVALSAVILAFKDDTVAKLKGLATEIIKALIAVPRAIIDSFKDIGKIIVAVLTGDFKALPNLLKSAGNNLLKANPLTAVGIAIGKEFGGNLVEAFKDTFGSAKPTLVEEGKEVGVNIGEELGANIGKGVGKGLKKALEDAGEDLSTFRDITEGVSEAFAKLDADADILGTQRIDVLRGQVNILGQALSDLKTKGLEGSQSFTDFAGAFASAKEELTNLEGLEEAKVMVADFAMAVSTSMKQGAADIIAGSAAIIGEGLAAGQSAAAIGTSIVKGIFTTIAGIAIQLGKTAIVIGIGIKGIKKAFQSLNPIVAIAAGVALLALGAGLKAAIQSSGAPALAKGALATGPTLAMVGDNPGAAVNPEVIAPLDRLQGLMGGGGSNKIAITGEFLIKGDTLRAVIDKSDKRQKRVGRS